MPARRSLVPAWAAASLVTLALGCSRPEPASPDLPPSRAAAEAAEPAAADDGVEERAAASGAAAGAGAELPPLEAEGPWAELPLEGFSPAVVGVPVGARRPRPVAVAAHGAGDNPSWQCEWWRKALGDRAFIVCPRGRASAPLPSGNMGYVYASDAALEREIDASLAALRARFGAHVDPGPALYMGFSQGAMYGLRVLARRPSLFRRAVLIEGGYYGGGFSREAAARFARGGGERVLLACGVPICDRTARADVARLEASGVSARSVYAPGAGHTYWGTGVEREVFGALSWVLEGDGRFAPP